MNEQQAIHLCLKKRDPAGFAFLFKKYRRMAYKHAVSLLCHQEDAADACQESFSMAYGTILTLPALDAFYPWFYRILRNHCLNVLSRKQTAETYQQGQKSQEHEIDNTQNPLEIQGNEEQKAKVWQVLQSLNVDFREILVLKYIQDNNYQEISELLHIPRGTVMSRLYHARTAFSHRYNFSEGEAL